MAAPQAQQIEIPLTRGLRQDLESALMPTGGLVEALNVTFDKASRLKKRAGFRALGTSTFSKSSTFTAPAQRTGTGPRGELLAFTDTDTHLYFPAEDKMSAAGQSGAGLTSVLRAQVLSKYGVGADQAGSILFADAGAIVGHGGETWTLVAYTEIDSASAVYNVYVDLIDTNSGARALSATVVAAGASQTIAPRVVVIGSVAFVLSTSTSGPIVYWRIDLSGTTPSTTTGTLASDGDAANTYFDAAPSQGGFVVAYRSDNGSGGKRCMVRTFTSAAPPVQINVFNTTFGWLESTSGGFWSTPVMGIIGAGSVAERIYAVAYDPAHAATEYASWPFDLASINQTNQTAGVGDIAQVAIARAGSANAIALSSPNHSVLPSDPRGHIIPVILSQSGGSLAKTVQRSFANYTIASRFYRSSTDALFMFARFNDPSPASPVPNAQSHFLLVDWGTGTAAGDPLPVAHVANGLVPLAADSTLTGIGGIADLGSGSFLFVGVTNLGTTSLAGQQVGCWTCRFLGPVRYLSTLAHGALIVGGATPLAYDGQRLVEMSFYSYPAVGAPCWATSTTGGSMAAGTYGYSFMYEWTDAAGNRHQSPPSPRVIVDISSSATSTNKTTWTVPTLHATRKQRTLESAVRDTIAPVRIVVYRTAANDSGGTLHKTGANGIVNTASAAAVTIVDGNADAASVTGSDTAVNVNTTANKTILIRADASRPYSSITVTSGAATPKTTIVTDLNAGFLTNGLALVAAIAGTNQIFISTTGSYIDIDTVAHGSNLNTAVGFAAGGVIVTGTVSANEIQRSPTSVGGNGIISSSAPPPSLMTAVHAGRLWGIDAEDPERVWCTKIFETGEAPGYNPGLQVLIPGCGRINGLAGQDGKLYALCQLGIYMASYGDGPDNTGANGTFPSPELITTSSNCDDPRGVATGDDGVYFTGQDQQTTTVYLIARGNASPRNIGTRLRTSLASTPQIRGVGYRQEKARMEFLFVDSDMSPTTSMLVYYHYKLQDEEQIGQWTRATVSAGAPLTCLGDWNIGSQQNPRLTTVIGYVTTNIAVQDDAVLVDPTASQIGFTIQTGDIRPNGMLAYGESYSAVLLGTSQSADDFTLKASFDGGLTFQDSVDFPVPETSGPMVRRWDSPTKKLPLSAVAYQISENLGASGNVAGCVFHALVLEAIALGSVVRLPAGKQS